MNEKESKNNKNEKEKDRKQWKEETDLSLLNQKSLVSSTVKIPSLNKQKSAENPVTPSPRKGWGQPHETILSVWEKVEVIFSRKKLKFRKLKIYF